MLKKKQFIIGSERKDGSRTILLEKNGKIVVLGSVQECLEVINNQWVTYGKNDNWADFYLEIVGEKNYVK